MKKVISVLLVIVMLCSTFAGLQITSHALASSGSCGESVTFTFDATTGELVIRGSGSMMDYSSSSKSPFNNQFDIKTVVINTGVTSIGEYAFFHCIGITSVTVPDSVTSIGNYAFDACYGLTSVTIGNSVTSIGDSAFYDCRNLKSIIIPDSVTSIGGFAFYDCTSLTSVTIGNSVTRISDFTFHGCSSLTSIIIGDSVTSIVSSAFEGCSGLKELTMPCSARMYGGFQSCTNIEKVTLTKGTGMMQNYSSSSGTGDAHYQNVPWYYSRNNLKEMVIEDGVKNIGNYVFYWCKKLTSIDIPNSVLGIGNFAFSGCGNLTAINIPDSVTYIGEFAFSDCRLLSNIDIPNSVLNIGEYAFSGCNAFTNITIPSSVTSIGDYAFYKCGGLTSITIPDSVTSIGDGAFKDCSSLTNISIPKFVASIGNSAFSGCSILTSVDIPDSVTSLGDLAFQSCSGLTSITIPDSVTSIGDGSFKGCSSLTSVTIPKFVTSLGSSAFFGCSSLTSITIPDSVTSIGNSAFYDCSGLKEITMPCSAGICDSFRNCTNIEKITLTKGTGTMQNFGTSASNYVTETYYQYTPWYINQNNLKEFVIEAGVSSIGAYAFYGCSGLTNITIPDSVSSIGNSAFYNCSGLKELTMPASAIINNSSDTFGGCTNIEKVTLTKGTGNMPNYGIIKSSFANDTYYQFTPWYISRNSLNSLVFEDGVTNIGTYAFTGCSGLTSITIPDSVISIGWHAFEGTAYYENALNWSNDVLYIGNALIKTKSTINGAYQIRDRTTCIADLAFSDCKSLTNITIPDSVCGIGSYAFYNCSSLTNISIPDSVTSIGSCAFCGCSGLTSVNISSIEAWCKISFGSVESNPFYYAQNLYLNGELITDLAIPDSVTSIGSYAFSGCSGLTSVTIPNSVTSIGDYAFCDCSKLTSITIPDSVTSIGNFAFFGCSSLANISIPDSVTSIGNSAFEGCSELKELTMPCSVKIYNSENTFKNCTNIEKITLTKGTGTMQDFGTSFAEDSVDTYYQFTPWFLSRATLKKFVLEDGVEHIGTYAFYAQSNIPRILIPTSVTNIGEHAFGLCSALKEVYYPGSEAQWNQMAVAADNDALIGATIHFNHIHQFENPVVTATCTEGGKKTGVCACGKIQEETVPALGHAFSEWTLTKAPTCTAEGIETRVCARDASHKETRTVDALGHHFEADKQYCLNGCGKRNPDYVPPHVHNYTLTVTKPTCTKQGFITHTCPCGESYIDSYTAPTGKLTLKHSARTANAVKVVWNNVKTATGYQVQISNKGGKKWDKAYTLKAGTTAYTFKNLAAGNAYKFRVRFYITAPDGKNYFSPWSSTLTSPTLPAGTTLTKLIPAKKAFTAQWKKNAAVNGYQVQYSLKPNFSSAKTITVKSPKTLKATMKSLSAKKTYYVRIRTYKTIAKVNYFSTWSKTYKVKTK